MKRLKDWFFVGGPINALLLILWLVFGTGEEAHASNCPTYPYTLTNGQVADANQVMANFNSILNCANSTLTTGGTNSTITALTGLTTPLSVPQGGTGVPSLTAHGVVIGEGASALAATSAGTAGQVLVSGGSSADPSFGGAIGPLTATLQINLSSGFVPLIMNQNGSSNNVMQWETSGTSTWELGTFVTTNDFLLFNTGTNVTDWICTHATDVCAFAHEPTVSGSALVAHSDFTSCSGAGQAVNYNSGTLTFGCIGGIGGGTVTTSGSPASGNLAKFTNTTVVSNGDLSGDCTTTGTLAVTCLKTNGSAFGTAALANTGTSGGTLCLLSSTCVYSNTVQINLSSGFVPLIMNQNGSSNNVMQWETSGTSTWELGTFVTTNDFLLFNTGTNVTDWICTHATDICTFTNTPLVGSNALVLTNDSRFGGVTQNSQSTAYGLVLTDAGKQIYHPSADTTARTWTIPANGSVAFPIGTKIDLVNDCSAGVITVAITTDTLAWYSSGTTGSRALAACGEATLSKVTSTRWVITGVGLS